MYRNTVAKTHKKYYTKKINTKFTYENYSGHPAYEFSHHLRTVYSVLLMQDNRLLSLHNNK